VETIQKVRSIYKNYKSEINYMKLGLSWSFLS